MTAADSELQGGLFEASALAALERAKGQAEASDAAMQETVYNLEAANLPKLAQDVQRARELHRLFTVRLASLLHRLGEGAP